MPLAAAVQKRFSRLAAGSFTLLALASAAAVKAGDSALITGTGTVPTTVSVEVPDQQSSGPPQIASDGASMTVANTDPLTLIANVPSRVELSRLQLEAPSGVNPSRVGAEINLRVNGSLLVAASTSSGGSRAFGILQAQATVDASFYSTTEEPLPPGRYTATTVLSLVDE